MFPTAITSAWRETRFSTVLAPASNCARPPREVKPMPHKQQFCNLISHTISRRVTVALAMTLALGLTLVSSPAARAQTYMVIHDFTGADGASPQAGVTVDRGGNLYCTTSAGGPYNRGGVCKLSHQGSGWMFKSLYNFPGPPDASVPLDRIVIGPDGSLYGATEFGGRNCGGGVGCGTVYKLQPPLGPCKTSLCPWTETVLYRFSGGGDGANPGYGDLVFDAAGNIYGTTFFGGVNAQGVVYKLTRSGSGWTESPICVFGGTDGASPFSGVVFDSAGNLYGTTNSGGANGYGTVYKLSPSGSGWTESTLYSFDLTNSGGSPYGGVILDSAGNLYGGTSSGGTGSGGTIFQLSPSGGGWTFALLYSLTGTAYQPGLYSNLVRDAAGNLYGTAAKDGANGFGAVFKLTPEQGGWTYTSLHAFTGGSDGAYPIGGVAFDANGNLFGTAKSGGAHGDGVVWEITP